MSRDIKRTPSLTAEEWLELQKELDKGCSDEEMARRRIKAHAYVERMSKPKPQTKLKG
jgi:hypothetical protein